MVDCALYDMHLMFHFFRSVAVDQVFDCFGAVYYFCHHFVSMCDGGPGKLSVAKMYCVCEALIAGGFYVAPMCKVVLM